MWSAFRNRRPFRNLISRRAILKWAYIHNVFYFLWWKALIDIWVHLCEGKTMRIIVINNVGRNVFHCNMHRIFKVNVAGWMRRILGAIRAVKLLTLRFSVAMGDSISKRARTMICKEVIFNWNLHFFMRIVGYVPSKWNAWSRLDLLALFVLFLYQSSQIRLVS